MLIADDSRREGDLLAVFNGLASALAWLTLSTTAAPPVRPLEPPAKANPHSVLLRFLPDDPTAEIAAIVALSPEQIDFSHQRYAAYHDRILELAQQAQDNVIKRRDWERRNDLTPEQAAEMIRAVHRSLRDENAKAAALEAELFAEVGGMLAESQQTAFRTASLEISRRTWLGPGRAKQQDFFQFADPVAIVRTQRALLEASPDNLQLLDVMLRTFEDEMATDVPDWVFDRNDARQALRAARASGDADKTQAANQRYVALWIRLFERCCKFIDHSAAVFANAGIADAGPRMKEEFWIGALPGLFGHETTQASLESVDLTQLDAETAAAVSRLRIEYFAGRHQLLNEIVSQYVDDYRQSPPPFRPQPLGATSVALVNDQIRRCRLAIQARERLHALVPGAAAGAQSPNPDGLLIDSKEAETYLATVLKELDPDHSAPGTEGSSIP